MDPSAPNAVLPSNINPESEHKLILGSAISGSTVLLIFCVYVAFRLSRGASITEIFRLRRTRRHDLPIEDERNPFASMGEIQRTQRYSVRSQRFSRRSSWYSIKHNKHRSKIGKASPLGHEVNYAAEWDVPSPMPKHAMTKIDELGVTATKLTITAKSNSSIARPEMARVAPLPKDDIYQREAGLRQKSSQGEDHSRVATDKAKHSSTLLPFRQNTVHASGATNASVGQEASDSTPHRFSISSNPDCPPTPKFKLERSDSTGQLNPNLRMERIEEDGTQLGITPSRGSSFDNRRYTPRQPTDSVATLSSIIRSYTKPTPRTSDVESGSRVRE